MGCAFRHMLAFCEPVGGGTQWGTIQRGERGYGGQAFTCGAGAPSVGSWEEWTRCGAPWHGFCLSLQLIAGA
jgi:hypothetical protein